jgi:hypothetical protein
MKTLYTLLIMLFSSLSSQATIHIVRVWSGYFQFVEPISFSKDITINLGDTVHWLPLDHPMMAHTITSTNIPAGAATFDQIWQAPADTFFQYIPQYLGLYEYECSPHAQSHNMIGSITVINSPSSINESEIKNNSLFIYPNPANDIITFQNSVEGIFYIYDNAGQQVLTGKMENHIDITGLESGLYYFLAPKESRLPIKFIKK